MSTTFAYFDTEFNNTAHPVINPICSSIRVDGKRITSWVHKDKAAKAELRETILDLVDQGVIFCAWNVIAEARFIESIGLDPLKLKWIDLYLEYKMLLNQNHDMAYGRQLIKGKKVRTFPPKPKYQQTEEDKKKASNAKAENNLGAAVFKLLNIEIDTQRKKDVRDLIISTPKEFTEEEREEILEYCESDTIHLENAFKKIVGKLKKLIPPKEHKNLKGEMLFRGEFAARTAKMESIGIPFHEEWTRSLGFSIPYILKTIQEEINANFPDVKPFYWKKREGKYARKEKPIRDWIAKQEFSDRWTMTKGGKFSLAQDAWTQHFHFKYTYPKDNFGAQMIRLLKTQTSLKGFKAKEKEGDKSFWDSVGPDSRSRPFFNIYGSQTGRSQPGSTGFLFLKSAWMRALAVPPKGLAYAAVDFKSQEFLIGGLESGDMNMINAYYSGDVYLWFAIKAGAAPKNATKKTHGFIRDKFKSTVLGMQYRMGAKSLAAKLSQDTGVEHTEEEAQDLIDLFNDIFSKYAEWCEEVLDQYYYDGYLKTRDGWYMFGDNDNDKSITNFLVQGAGGGILRYSIKRAQEAGLDVPQSLHDALYILYPIGEYGYIDKLMKAMDQGFRDYYKGHPLEEYARVGLDPNTWSMEYEDGEVETPEGVKVKVQKIYIDGRGAEEYKNFSQYFHTLEDLELL